MGAVSVSVSAVVIVVAVVGSIVAVIAAILNRVEREVVHDDSGNVCPDLSQDITRTEQRLPAGLFGTGNEDDHVGIPGANHCVGHGQYWRRVNYDVANSSRQCCKNCGMASEASISDGYGGMCPAGMTCRPGISSICTVIDSGFSVPARHALRPLVPEMPRYL